VDLTATALKNAAFHNSFSGLLEYWISPSFFFSSAGCGWEQFSYDEADTKEVDE